MKRGIFRGVMAAVCFVTISSAAMAQISVSNKEKPSDSDQGKRYKKLPSLGSSPLNLSRQIVLLNSKGCHFTVDEDESSGILVIKKLNFENGEPWCQRTE